MLESFSCKILICLYSIVYIYRIVIRTQCGRQKNIMLTELCCEINMKHKYVIL